MIHVQCTGCGTWDIAGPGHPAVRFNPDSGQHELFDRTAFKHNHAEACTPDESGNYPLHFTLMAGTVAVGAVA